MAETNNVDQPRAGSTPRRWTFGAAAFDERAMQLFVAGRAVELELKPLEVLRFLLQRPGEAVSKDELVKAVWPGRVISDSALTSTIAKLREALGPEQDAIRTVHGFGYRLEAEVRAGDGAGGGATAQGEAGRAMRRLTAIMFTDLVGYSELAHRDEPLALELLELHRGWVREILPKHGGREIETIGDAFLVEFSGALAAVECAVAIQRRFAAHNEVAPEGRRMRLRIGIHAGDVQHKDGKVMGDGVNIASRIHGLADPGGICVSEDVQRAVRPHGYHLESLGTPALKNIASPLELYRVRLDDAPAPVPKRRWMGAPPRWLAGVAAGVLVVGLAAAWYFDRVPPADEAPPSVAVLPFTSMSADPENAYFTDGMHDTILTHLSRVHSLKVISRTSVMRFREGGRDLREIAKALGVDHVVEGSVQRAGSRLRITVQLIEASTDRHVWAENYDRDMADVFAVQSDVARRIAEGLRATLVPAEVARIERIPSRNAEAYDLYLRALLVARATYSDRKETDQAIAWLDRAVALDPGFALAHALLSSMHDTVYWSYDGRTAERLSLVARHADAAMALDPGLAEAHVARAVYLYHGFRDYEGGLRALEAARALNPGNAEVYQWLAAIQRRQGLVEPLLASLERAMVLDPLNAAYVSNYAVEMNRMRRHGESMRALERLARLAPDDTLLAARVAYTTFLMDGDLAPLQRALDEVPASFDPDCVVTGWRYRTYTLARQFEQAAAAVGACGDLFYFDSDVPLELVRAQGQWFASGRRHAPAAEQARARLERLLADNHDQPGRRATLAYALAMLGDAPRAQAEIEAALAAMPMSRDAYDGASVLYWAAAVYANTGARDRALEALSHLLRVPSHLYVQEVKRDPVWDPLRDDPRFQKLLASP
jgi:TolB-like protein/class 3 adenylate cyclase/tetratricopeptide (TPR) repeat protein